MKKIMYLATALAAVIAAVPAQAVDDLDVDGRVYYLRSNVIPPWDVTSNEVDMNEVFGASEWRSRQYETVRLSRLLSSTTSMIFMEGGDNNANALKSFLDAHRTELMAWVAAGGRLFINAAPNQGGDIDYGFGVTMSFNMDYSTASNNGYAVDSSHPIFSQNLQPVGTSFAGGNAFSHGYLTGSGFTAIMVDDQNRPVLAEIRYGSGLVLFGTMTVDIFQSPWPQSHNLRTNTIWYAATAQLN